MGQHGGDEIGVVHLLAGNRNASQQTAQLSEYLRPVFGDVEVLLKSLDGAIASAIGSGAWSRWGRVTVARYSRSTWRLIQSARHSPRACCRHARAWTWNAERFWLA